MTTRAQARPQSVPDHEAVRAALEAVLASDVFVSSGRAREFLRFIVEETLAGRSDRLKGYTIAVGVFGRSPDFDPQSDPFVRVEAGRLRRRLAQYYQEAGREDAVRIELPRGSYVPSFAHREQSPAAPTSGTGAAWRWRAGVGAVVALVAVAAWFLATLNGASPPVGAGSEPPLSRLPRVLVLPFEVTNGYPQLESFARGLTLEVIQAQVDFKILTTASSATGVTEDTSLRALRERYRASYALSGAVRGGADKVLVTARLTETSFGTQLWTRTIEVALGDDTTSVEERVGRSIAALVSSPYGPVYGHEILKTVGKSVDELDPYECLLRFYAYSRSLSRVEHGQVVRCMQRAVASEPGFAAAWSSLAVLYLHEYTYGYDPQPDRSSALDRSREEVRRALDLDGTGRVASMMLASLRLVSGNRAGFYQAVERGLALQPPHPTLQAQLGYSLAVAGDWHRGLPLLAEGMEGMAAVPGWYRAAFVLGNLEAGNDEQAFAAALRMDAPEWFGAPMLTAATAALVGRDELAHREVVRLLELEPDFAADGAELLRRWGMDDALLTKLVDALRLAGLDIS